MPQAFLSSASGKVFEPWNSDAYEIMDCSLNHPDTERNKVIKGQKSLSFYTHHQGFETAQNNVTRVYILSYDTIIRS